MADLLLKKSYYENEMEKRHASPHLFSYYRKQKQGNFYFPLMKIPEGEDKKVFSYASMKKVDYAELKKSEKI